MANIHSNGHLHPEIMHCCTPQYSYDQSPPLHVQPHPVHTIGLHDINELKEASRHVLPPHLHPRVHAMGPSYAVNGLDAAFPHVQNHPSDHLNAHSSGESSVPHMEHPHGKHACILAIARAVPPNKLVQSSYADFYFDITNCQHKTQLKHKMARICERSGVDTRHSIMTEEFLKQHPELYTPGVPSLEERHRILAEEVPRLASEAGQAAIREWGRPAHDITHLIVVTLSGVAMPGADVRLVQMLGLRPSVSRVMLYMLGCYAGITALRIAKDLAENNPGSRILICCSELSVTTFRAPHESCPYNLVASALFGDGAVGIVVGARPNVIPPPALSTSLSKHSLFPSSHIQYQGTSSDTSINIDNAMSIHEDTKSNATYYSKSTSGNYSYLDNSQYIKSTKTNGIHNGIISTSDINHHEKFSLDEASINPNGIHNNGWDIHYQEEQTHLHESMHGGNGKASNHDIGRNPHTKSRYISSCEVVVPHPPDSPHHHEDMFICEHPIYEMHTAIETIIPNTESMIEGTMKVEGLEFFLDRALPSIISDHVASFCEELLTHMPTKCSLNEVFWAVHSGGPAVLDAVEQAAKLDSRHLQASRHILSKYGNVSASTVLFVLDEIRKTTHSSESPEWGVAIAFGPGITFEGVLLRRV